APPQAKMVDVTLEAVNGDALPKDLYLSLRVGEQQKFAKAGVARTYKFGNAPGADKRYGKLEIYRRIGVASVSLDPEKVQGTHELCVQVEDPRLEGNEVKYRLCLGASSTAAHPQASPDKAAGGHVEKVNAAKEYLAHHQLEMRLSEAMQAVLRERPEDPGAFLAKKLQSSAGTLRKVDEPMKSAPPAVPAAPPALAQHDAEPAPAAEVLKANPHYIKSAPPAPPASIEPAPAAEVLKANPHYVKSAPPAPPASIEPAPAAEVLKANPHYVKSAPPAPPAAAVATKSFVLDMPMAYPYPLPSHCDPIMPATLMIGAGMCCYANIGRPAVMVF
ncbi:unnamed protein product, partial [Polarella glacialis]